MIDRTKIVYSQYIVNPNRNSDSRCLKGPNINFPTLFPLSCCSTSGLNSIDQAGETELAGTTIFRRVGLHEPIARSGFGLNMMNPVNEKYFSENYDNPVT